MTPLPRTPANRAIYAGFRKTWSPKASYVLTRFHAFRAGPEKLAALIWLIHQRIPTDGVYLPWGPAHHA